MMHRDVKKRIGCNLCEEREPNIKHTWNINALRDLSGNDAD